MEWRGAGKLSFAGGGILPFKLTEEMVYRYHVVYMKHVSTRQVAKMLGLSHVALVRYMADGKIPTPDTIEIGGLRVHTWTDEEIEHVRQLLPRIANGRKTRYKKQSAKTKAQPKSTVPRKKRSSKKPKPASG